jgi:hypothetical protein
LGNNHNNENESYHPCPCPQDCPVEELEARAGALVNEALADWPDSVKYAHWEDMKHTAMLAFLEYQDMPASYGYAVAQR